jgi:UDP-N-acetylmuramoyl-tripeptide--D-alanyl-D-alanine ligase
MAIIEMGANHHGEIDALCRIAYPDYGLVTNVGKAHLEGFGGIEGVARAKGELIRHLIENNKTVFLNAGNKWLANQVPDGYPYVIRYNASGGLIASDVKCDPYLSLIINDGTGTLIKTNLAGGYNAENVLAACTVGMYFGIPMDQIKEAISKYVPRNNRSQIIKTKQNTVFMDAYNANPSSMAVAIIEFLKTGQLNKLLILGEMREIGINSEEEHGEIVSILKKSGVSNVFFLGKAFEKSATLAGYQYASSVEELGGMLKQSPPEGYYIMVKGSRSNKLEKVLEFL